MTPQDAEKLAEDIKRVMELDAKRTPGEWTCDSYDRLPYINAYFFLKMRSAEQEVCDIGWPDQDDLTQNNADFIAAAPTMATIIRQLIDIVRARHEALEAIIDGYENNESESDMFSKLDIASEKCKRTIALSAPLVKEGV